MNRSLASGSLVLLLAAFLELSCSQPKPRQVGAPLSELRSGEYLRDRYIQALCATLSPLRATATDDSPELLTVDRDEHGLSLSPSTNFHEGGELYRLTSEGELRGEEENGPLQGFTLKSESSDEISLGRSGTRWTFRFVGKADRWVSEAVIAGTYRDAKGKQYVFQPDGQALFPNNLRFDYTLAMDYVLTSFDYVYSSGLHKTWAVSINPSGLTLYDVKGEFPDEVPSKIPRWRLTRLTPVGCR